MSEGREERRKKVRKGEKKRLKMGQVELTTNDQDRKGAETKAEDTYSSL